MSFELFDPKGDLEVRHGQLPHWYQPGVTYFITYRTEDSVPQNLLRSWRGRREHWLRKHGFDPAVGTWQTQLRLNRDLDREFHSTFTREFMEYLDRGLGACVLRNPKLADIVAESLRHFDGQRYLLGDFVVMPNHVHLLACLLGTTDLEVQCRSWKKYSANRINKLLGQRGRFWQEESFDHLVRSPEQFERLRRYIAENPIKANLALGNYLHYVRP